MPGARARAGQGEDGRLAPVTRPGKHRVSHHWPGNPRGQAAAQHWGGKGQCSIHDMSVPKYLKGLGAQKRSIAVLSDGYFPHAGLCQ